MKLASYKDGSRDGQLVVVSRDLSAAHYATGIATRLQQVLDDWNFIAPQLEDLSQALNQGRARHAFAFQPAKCMAPLPRAFQWVDGSAYLNHVALARQARGAEMPPELLRDPLMYQGGSDDLLGPTDDIRVPSEKMGIDFEAEIAVVTGDVPMGASPEQALEGIRLVMLANDVSLRHLVPAELAKGFGFCQSKPATAFSPVAVTPDELSAAWMEGRVHLDLACEWNGKRFGLCEAGPEMHFHFGQLIAHLCKTRNVRAGSIIGSGTVSNADPARGQTCIAEKRARETLEHGEPKTGFMKHGDSVRIDMKGRDGVSVFGAIHQSVVVGDAPGADADADAKADANVPRAMSPRRRFARHTAALALGALPGFAAAGPAAEVGCEVKHFDDKRFTVCRLDPSSQASLEIFLADARGQAFVNFDALSQWLAARGKRLRWAMNAGMYHRDLSPVGWLVSGAHGRTETLGALNTEDGQGNFFLKPNGVFLVSPKGAAVLSTDEARVWRGPVTLATQSGPLLVRRGQLHPALLPDSPSRLVRNGVGVSASGVVWFAISDEPVNFHAFARLFRDGLDCPDALYLDGNISSLYAPALGRHDRHAPMGPILALVA
jgi:fumarylacetoacetate (FAA) hydrolase